MAIKVVKAMLAKLFTVKCDPKIVFYYMSTLAFPKEEYNRLNSFIVDITDGRRKS